MEDTKTFVVLFEKTDEYHGIIDRGGRAAGTMVSLDNFTWLAEMGSEEEKYGLDLIFEDERKKVHHNYLGFKEEFDVDTIKIDVEGYEYKVLRGAKETLKKYKPLMFLEIHQHLLKLYDADIMDVYASLKDCKYKIYDIHNNQVKDEEQYINLFHEVGEIRVVCKGE